MKKKLDELQWENLELRNQQEFLEAEVSDLKEQINAANKEVLKLAVHTVKMDQKKPRVYRRFRILTLEKERNGLMSNVNIIGKYHYIYDDVMEVTDGRTASKINSLLDFAALWRVNPGDVKLEEKLGNYRKRMKEIDEELKELQESSF